MSEAMTPESDRPKGSPAFLIMLVVILGLSFAAGALVGAGGASIIGGFIALFSLLATMGGPLRADLRRLAVIGPLVAFSAVAPRLIAEASVAWAIALMTVLVFVAGLLPIRARRYDSVALGVGMGTLLGYSIPLTSRADAGQFIIAAIVGLVVAVALRVLLGIADPTGPTRKAVAGLLDESSSDFSTAFETWLSDRPARWLGTVLIAAGRYRLARRVLRSADEGNAHSPVAATLDEAGVRAAAIATAVSAKKAETSDAAASTPTPSADGALAGSATAAMNSALDEAERAARERDAEIVPLPAGFRRRLSLAAVRSGLRHGTVQVRHAIRAAIAVLIALLISLFLPPGDPLLPTLLVTTFAIVQSSWRATLSRARDRFLGLIVGGALVVVIVLVVPEFLLLPISLVGLAVGLWFITARPAIGTAGIIVMSVGLNSEMRHLDPYAVIIEYVVLSVLALVIGGLIGFIVVPAWRPPSVGSRADSAVSLSAGVLRRLADGGLRDTPRAALESLGDAQGATQQLIPDHEKLTPAQEESLERLRTGLQDLLVTALFLTSQQHSSESGPTEWARAADILEANPSSASEVTDAGPMTGALTLLANEVRQEHATFIASLGAK